MVVRYTSFHDLMTKCNYNGDLAQAQNSIIALSSARPFKLKAEGRLKEILLSSEQPSGFFSSSPLV